MALEPGESEVQAGDASLATGGRQTGDGVEPLLDALDDVPTWD